MDKLERREKWNRKCNHKRNDRNKNFKKNQKKLDVCGPCFSFDDDAYAFLNAEAAKNLNR